MTTGPIPAASSISIPAGSCSAVISGLIHLVRLARVGFVLTREGVLGLVDPAPLAPAARLSISFLRFFERRNSGGARLARAMTRLGPTYVKLGQFLATRPDLVGIHNARELEQLQDRMPTFPRRFAKTARHRRVRSPSGSAAIGTGPAPSTHGSRGIGTLPLLERPGTRRCIPLATASTSTKVAAGSRTAPETRCASPA